MTVNNSKPQTKLIDIGYVNRVRFFSLAGANALLPIINKITRNAYNQIKIHDQILQHDDLNDAFLESVTRDRQALINQWIHRLEQLGAQSNHFGSALFDTGFGYLVWQFPQYQIRTFLSYDNMNVEHCVERIQYTNPQWLNPIKLKVNSIGYQNNHKAQVELSAQQTAQ